MPDQIIILSGTRDELGGVEVGIVNVYAREERPGVLSAMLVLPDGDRLIAVGDELELGDRRFRLEAMTPHRTGATNFVFAQLETATVPKGRKSTVHAITPTGALDLVKLLRARTPDILGHLARGDRVLEISKWSDTSKDTMTTEWNGMQSGPSTLTQWQAEFSDTAGAEYVRLESSISLDRIRYNPDEIHRLEVSGFWRVGDRNAHIFLRGEGRTPLAEFWTATEDIGFIDLIQSIIAQPDEAR